MAVELHLPPKAWLVALAGLPKMGPARLLALSLIYEPAEAWAAVSTGAVLTRPDLVERMGTNPAAVASAWREAAAHVSVEERWVAHGSVEVAARGEADYPAALASDLEPPAVVFTRGDRAALDGPSVAIVGTRRCTRYGFDVALELGRGLATAGVTVVSGLAIGVDGAAHRGAVDAGAAPPVGVVASGLDIVYPRRHAALWDEVATAGLLVSEAPVGCPPEPWRFPARNRIIAALAEAVVVVESAGRGGSMYTVEEAMARDVPVLAVPGSIRSAASAGTNLLLHQGAHVVRDVDDVLTVIGHHPPRRSARARARDPRARPGPDGRRILRALGSEPATLETLALGSGLALGPLSVAVAQLEADGWVARAGLWFERMEAPR